MIMPFPGAVCGKRSPLSGTTPIVGPQSFGPLAWPTWSDFSKLAQAYAQDLFGYPIDVRLSDMRCLQDLLCYAFIRQNLPHGSRLLEVGGGWSRVLASLASDYECWCVDAFEGADNGATTMPAGYGYKIIVDFMGNRNAALPDTYFDFVFSISALGHAMSHSESDIRNIFDDIRRVSRPSAYTLHCIDYVCRDGTSVFAEGVRKLYSTTEHILESRTEFVPVEDIYSSRLYSMPEKLRNKKSDRGDIFPFNALFFVPESPKCTLGFAEDAISPPQFEKTIPHIHVVTPCFNIEGFIDQTIASVVSQKGEFFLHYHVQDGGSTDATVSIVEKWARDIARGAFPICCAGVTFTWESAPDAGMYDAIAKTLARHAADEEFVGWINADDILIPGALAAVTELTYTCPDVEWILGQRLLIREDSQVDEYVPGTRYPREVVAAGICDGQLWQFIQQEGTFWRAALWRRAGGFDSRLPNAGDWDLWRRFAETAVPHQILAPLGAFRRRKGQKSSDINAYHREIDQVLPQLERRLRLEAIHQAERLTIRCIEPSPTGELRNLTRSGLGPAGLVQEVAPPPTQNSGTPTVRAEAPPARNVSQMAERLSRLAALGQVPPQDATALLENALRLTQQMLDAGEHSAALTLVCAAKHLAVPVRGLDYLRAMAFQGLEDSPSAREALKEELRFFPDNAQAREALNALPCLLNIGCGHARHPAWINMDVAGPPDVIPRDVSRGIPFRDGAFDAVYHSHMLEHLPRGAVPGFLADCLRVLKPGGVLRVAVPDLEGVARAYLLALEQAAQGDARAAERHEWMVVELVDQLCRHIPGGEMRAFWLRDPVPARDFVEARLGAEAAQAIRELHAACDAGRAAPANPVPPDSHAVGAFRLGGECHRWMYDRFSLRGLLEGAGFGGVRVCRADDSSIEGFNAYGLDLEPDQSVRKPDSLFMEAFKPAVGAEAR